MTAQLVATEAPAWEDAVEAYLRDCRRRNLASTTIAEYRYVLSSHARIVSWRRGTGIRSIADLTGQSLWSLEMELTDAGVSAGAVATIHRRLHSFGVWCEKRYGVGGGVRTVSPPLQRQTFPETYTDDQVDAVLRAARTARDRLIVEVLVHTGLRASELCNLVCSDVQSDRAGAWLRVRQGKGRKDRHVPLDTPATQLSQAGRFVSAVARAAGECETAHMRPGPPPTPTALRVLHGDPPSRTNRRELVPRNTRPSAPRWLTPRARSIWRSTARELTAMRVLTSADATALGLYAQALDEYITAAELVARDGVVVPGRDGGAVANPACRVEAARWSMVERMGAQFGLSPTSRLALAAPGPAVDDPAIEALFS